MASQEAERDEHKCSGGAEHEQKRNGGVTVRARWVQALVRQAEDEKAC